MIQSPAKLGRFSSIFIASLRRMATSLRQLQPLLAVEAVDPLVIDELSRPKDLEAIAELEALLNESDG